MILELLVYIIFAVVLMLLIIYFYYRDRGVIKQFELYELAITDLNERMQDIEKQSSGTANASIDNIEKFSQELGKIESQLNDKLNELSDPLLKTIRAVKDVEVQIARIDASINDRINKLEENAKLSNMSNNAKLINEKAIVDLYKAGYSAEEIAKRERTPIGEVELILRIANLR